MSSGPAPSLESALSFVILVTQHVQRRANPKDICVKLNTHESP